MMKSKSVKKFATGLLTGALLLSGIFYLPMDSQNVYAAGTEVIETKVTESGVYMEKMDVEAYRKDGKRVAPKPHDESHKDWVFAGWYTMDDCKQENALGKNVESGVYWAKYVPAELLSVKCQTLTATVANTPMSKMRLVSTVDGLEYDEVGFDIKMKDWAYIYNTNTVYETVAARDDGVSFDYAPTDFHSMARYFTTVTLTDIYRNNYKDEIFITPFWTTLDGTKVYGVSRYARVEDYYLKIVNVPVRLYSNTQVAAGYLEIGYDTDKFEYVGTDAGYDIGTIFEEMEVSEGNGYIRCVGNVKDISSDKAADGMYVNLRFARKNLMTTEAKFGISNARFCDKDEQIQALKISDIPYKQIVKEADNQ